MQSNVTRKMKVLIVQPDPAARDALFALLTEPAPGFSNPIRYELFTAQSFAQGLELVNTVYPDLVLIPVAMSQGEGQALCRDIRSRERERHTGIIFVATESAYGEMLPVECLELGADDFFNSEITPREALARINAVLRLKDMTDELRSANHRLELLSLTDELTGLHNMRSFNLQYAQFLSACRLGESGLGVIMIDLDHFKQINDTNNHLMGSHVISDVGKLIRLSGILGTQACPARYGGDEYVIAMLSPSIDDICDRAENLRVLLESAYFAKDDFAVRITASIGVAWIDPGFQGKQEDPIKAADAMLYRSKRLGRNRVSAMLLRYPIDFDHIGRPHLVERDAGSDDHSVAGTDKV